MAPAGEASHYNPPGHQRTKSSGLRSLIQRRQLSKGENILPVTSPLETTSSYHPIYETMAIGNFAKNNPGALGELQHNQQESAPRSPQKPRDDGRDETAAAARSRSPTKTSFLSIGKSRETSPKKPKKTKSGTNLAGLLSRPKSLKNLRKLAIEDDARSTKDKENRTPDGPLDSPPPIYAQFTSDVMANADRLAGSGNSIHRKASDQEAYVKPLPLGKERPKSVMLPTRAQQDWTAPSFPKRTNSGPKDDYSVGKQTAQTQRSKIFGAFAGSGHRRAKSAISSPKAGSVEETFDLKDIDKQLEALLDRRNIPENQRYKMRNLTDTIKTEFIRQDWAEMQAARADRQGTKTSIDSSNDGRTQTAASSDDEDDRPKQSRGRSFTFSRGKKDNNNSATKKSKGEGTLGRHFRSKSTDSIVNDRPISACSSSGGTSLLAKMKFQQGPGDYVAYLRKVQQPELVEVGKIQKLRQLLRNETVAWIEDFIQQGGMKEVVGLLNRIMGVEWREEHEDALLHENLLCLKALSTTARAMEFLHSVQGELFPKLLHMLFDPEKKGPSEFTTRNIITSVLLMYIESAAPAERVLRAKSVLGHLRDKEPEEATRALPFVLEMRQERPYRVWCKEAVNVTKEVFWIFLHNLNVIALPSESARPDSAESAASRKVSDSKQYRYMVRHFPQERPPVPAAPYVGGVEWDATNYLASHLDLMNAILACTPTAAERNLLRAELRISGWERCLGGTLRLCKEKFYGSVHTALRTWVAAAAEDMWDVKDIRYGPPPESRSPIKKTGGGQRKKVEEAPKIDIPKLDLGLEQTQNMKDAWLS